MRYNRPNPVSTIQWKTHAKRFARGFPIETLELYFGMAVVIALIGVLSLEVRAGEISSAQAQDLARIFKFFMWFFLAIPFIRGFGMVIGVPLANRYGFEVNLNE